MLELKIICLSYYKMLYENSLIIIIMLLQGLEMAETNFEEKSMTKMPPWAQFITFKDFQ